MTTKIQLLMRESDEKNTKKKRERTSIEAGQGLGGSQIEDER